MSQAAEKLQAALAELQIALASQSNVEPAVRERLEHALVEIRGAIDKLPDSERHETLTGQLSSVAQDFEVSHPNLSGMVGSVIDALARMGI
jgi:hypothetical protein